ncbi:MAG TPA: sigma-70 family RNA polymerase sigma factor, partial [Polyangiaceae bacterium]|nr:sigma-70 family RNA polymerase sigma factor [Polyangiaceae bacterium]
MTLATSSDDTQQPNATEPAPAPSPDAALLARVRSGDAAAFEILMRRYNQRLYRVARSVVKDSAEAEDVVQQAYLLAYVNADQFAGRSSLSTWLTRIALNEALGRVRRRGRDVTDVNAVHDWRSGSNMAPDPEDQVSRRELARLLESAVDRLPENYRVVFALRELEGLDGNEV